LFFLGFVCLQVTKPCQQAENAAKRLMIIVVDISNDISNIIEKGLEL